LHKSISIVNGTKEKISKLEGSVNVKNKFCSIIEKNVGFQKLNEISEVINGNFSTELDLEPHFISKFKFAPITSCDVEMSVLAKTLVEIYFAALVRQKY
jgi:hypothetical protein